MSRYEILIPLMPPSINSAYGGKGKRYLSPKVKKFKKAVEKTVFSDPKSYFAAKSLKDKILKFDLYISKPDWFTKDGRVKRNDITNRIKIIEDSVMEALGLDDSQVWSFHAHKISSTFESAYCVIEDIEPDHKKEELSHLFREIETILQKESDLQSSSKK